MSESILSPKSTSSLQTTDYLHQQQHYVTDEEINLSEVFSIVKTQKKFIFLVMLVMFVIALLYTISTPPIYESTALIQIESKSSGGMDSLLRNLSTSVEVNVLDNSSSPLSIEEALMSSRFILQPTIENLGLNVQITPHYFPIFGSFIAHRHKGQELTKPFLGLSKYAWGGETVKVQQFIVPQDFVNNKFLLKINADNSYTLFSATGEILLKGKVGELAQSKDSAAVPGIKILVSSINANPGLEYFISSKPIDNILQQIANNFTINDLGLQNKNANGRPMGETGVLTLSLKGPNAEQLPLILNTIVYYDIQKNIDKKTAEAEKTLSFLEQQSLSLKNELDKAEDALSKYKSTRGALGVSSATQILLNQLVDLEKSISEIKIKKTQLLQEFTAQHPYIIALNEQQNKLKLELSALEGEVKTLPKTEQKILSLEREVKGKNDLYSLMLSKIQHLQIVREGTISDVRVLVPAIPAVKIPSKSFLILVGSLLFGFILALAIILIRRISVQRMDDPDYIEERLGIALYAVIPHSKNQRQLLKDVKLGMRNQAILATMYANDLAIEGLRSLRTILFLSIKKAKNNIVAILGASPNIGKSFVSMNLAYVLADGGKRVLLIDADMRRGKIHSYLAQSTSPGLADILAEKVSFEKAKKSLNGKVFINGGGVDFISCGKYPSNPAELLFGDAVENFVQQIAAKYDVVIIDTPPVLAAADASIIAKCADTNLLLIGSKTENIKVLEHTIGRLRKHNIAVQGLVFNNTTPADGYGYGYGYGYSYDNNNDKKTSFLKFFIN